MLRVAELTAGRQVALRQACIQVPLANQLAVAHTLAANHATAEEPIII